jgi:hypothetical protein
MAAAAGSVYEVPKSISSHGSREVTADINTWLASIPNGTSANPSTVVFARNGTYWVDDTILVGSKSYLHINGNGSTFVRRNQLPGTASQIRGRAHWRFTSCNNFEYVNITVQGEADPVIGYDATKEAQHAFTLLTSTWGHTSNCIARDVWGDGFNFATAGVGGSNHHTVDNYVSGTVHRQGVSVTTGDDIVFSGAQFGHSWRSAVDLEPNSNRGFATHITFENCSWESHQLNWLSAAARGGVVSDVTMSNCTDGTPLTMSVSCDPTYTDASGITPRRANFTIVSNQTSASQGSPSGAVMSFANTDGFVTVTNNVQPLQPGRTPPMRVARFDAFTTANAVITYGENTPDLG